MKAKSLLLGAAATLIAATGAQAADMPLAPVREPVYRCDITGFYEVPGTDVCLRISGYTKAGVIVAEKGGTYAGARDFDDGNDVFQMYATARLRVDARTATEYGTVRGFIEAQWTDNDTSTGGPLLLRQAFVQVGNWVFGKAWSTFYHGASSPSYSWPYAPAGDDGFRTVQIRYTQPFGNGFALMVAIEDPARGGGDTAVAPGATISAAGVVTPAVAGFTRVQVNEVPNLVGAITFSNDRIDAKLSGALVWNETYYTTATGAAVLPFPQGDHELGYAIGFGINIAVPALGDGDNVGFKAIYASGASLYTSVGGRGQVVGCAVAGCLASSDQVEIWSVLGWVQHFWRPDLWSYVGAGYHETDVVGISAVSGEAITGTSDQFSVYANLIWSPVNNLEFLVEGFYDDGTLVTGGGSGPNETFGGFFEVTRYF